MTEKKESFFSKVFGGGCGCGCCNVKIEEIPEEEAKEVKTTAAEAKEEN
jgi:ferredoxin